MATYNCLQLDKSGFNSRKSYFKTIINEINPDIFLTQEIKEEAAADSLLSLLNETSISFSRAPYINGPDMDNMLFYRDDVVSLISQNTIQTSPRYLWEYVVKIGSDTLRIYSCHLKASSSESDEQTRLGEVTALRNYLNELPENSEFIIVGDLNLYDNAEPAYQKLIADETNNIGRAKDWLASGSWHNSSTYASIHTQSTRTTDLGDGGSTGGLDDRFDFILTSQNLNDASRIEYVADSMTPFGNDGNLLNKDINNTANTAVSTSVADALWRASDHLPVIAEFEATTGTSSAYESTVSQPADFQLYQNYPNPFNPTTVISYYLSEVGEVSLKVYDLLGREVAKLVDERQTSGRHQATFNSANLPSGLYFYRLSFNGNVLTKKMMLVK
ncbi:T9SS type A sorting domain-containing protein [Chloroherpeton thalassium]|uniref:T9SS type A sorting domain-containing protein n=1 Tax=Chloroherpeton thalassium TaxID=100716 RepID=UPI0003013455|nr:T9SS type A sorting domain-containing protein [Chloroherpeton thalassium]